MAGSSLIDEADGSSLVDPRPAAMKVDGTVYLMRHGRTVMDEGANRSDGWLDMPLTDKGRAALIDAQQLLKNVSLSKVYAANLKRTQETAEIIASGVMSEPEVVVDKKARTWNLGALAGVKKDVGHPIVQQMKQNPDTSATGGESFNEFKGRFLPWAVKVAKKAVADGQPILMVLSGSNLRLIGAELLGDESTTDLDEGGLAALYSVDGQWSAEVFIGHEDASPYES